MEKTLALIISGVVGVATFGFLTRKETGKKLLAKSVPKEENQDVPKKEIVPNVSTNENDDSVSDPGGVDSQDS